MQKNEKRFVLKASEKERFPLKTTFRGGVHPAPGSKKPTQHLPVRAFASDTVCIPMNMHIGAPSAPCVEKGERVLRGQVIAAPVGPLGLPVHASVSGQVVAIEDRPSLGAAPMRCIVIRNDFADEWAPLTPLGHVEQVEPSLIIPAIRNAGICGMGGAAFPTHVKLTPPPGKACRCVIVNGAECETHLTADHRLMLERGERAVDGLRAVMRALNVAEGVIVIEDNKPDAIAAMRRHSRGRSGVRVQSVRTKYPQGGEKQLIRAVTGKEVPSGGLPIDIGVVVLNVATCAAIADAVIDGRSLTERITTVTGCVREPANLLLRIGTLAEDAIGACGGFSENPGKVFFGGAMTGACLPDVNTPMMKATNGIVVMSREASVSVEEGPCIRCGKCVSVCPIGLNPYQIKTFADAERIDDARRLHVMDCILCGCCSYVCPARRWLTASFKMCKQKIAAEQKKKGGGKA